MPEARRLAQGAPWRAEVDSQPMAVPHLGNRHPVTLSLSSEADEVSDRRHRVFHEMGGGRAGRADHRSQGPTVCVDEHCVPFWSSQAFGLRQWYPVYESPTEEPVRRNRNTAGVCLGGAPSNERAGGISQPITAQRAEEKVGKGQGNVGRGGSQDRVDLSHHPII